MKTSFAFVALIALSATAAHAEIRFPDQQYTVLKCADNDHVVDYGTDIEIVSGGFAGLTLAHVSEETIHGPAELATVAVHSVPQTHSVAPVVYEGQDFELAIYTRLAPLPNGKLQAHLKAFLSGSAYDLDVACEFYAHTM